MKCLEKVQFAHCFAFRQFGLASKVLASLVPFIAETMLACLSGASEGIPDGADIQRFGDEVRPEEGQSEPLQETIKCDANMLIDIPVDEVSTRQADMDVAAKDMRMVALRCKDMPEVNRETRLLRKAVSDGAKSIMSGLDSSASECQKQLLDILDAGESSPVLMSQSKKHFVFFLKLSRLRSSSSDM